MSKTIVFLLIAGVLTAGIPGATMAQHCDRTSVGLIPINDLEHGLYRGWRGGLYPDGENVMPAEHQSAGEFLASQIQPLNANGQPDATRGKIVLLAIGMSNSWQEFSAFEGLTTGSDKINPAVVIVNGAQPGRDIDFILSNGDEYWSNVNDSLSRHGVTGLQVQTIWFKQAEAYPMFDGNDTTFHGYVDDLKEKFTTTMNTLRSRYPNAKVCYVASRSYGGYADFMLNPEPFAYYTGWAVKRLIEDQINGVQELSFSGSNPRAPWLTWGVYLWADGLIPRSDGLTWKCGDFQPDGTHPSEAGERKIAQALIGFFSSDPTTRPWFLGSESGIPCEDIDSFDASCSANGTVLAMVRLLNSTVHAGKTVQINLNGVVHSVVLVSNGIHTIGKLQGGPSFSGEHTISLVSPAGCFAPLKVNCQADSPEQDEFGRQLAEGNGAGEAHPQTELLGIYPNPFNPRTTIRYILGKEAHVNLKVYTTMGEEVATLIDEVQQPGDHSAAWDGRTGSGRNVASGVYLCRFTAGDVATVARLIILK